MTLDANPEFWKWLIERQRKKTIKDGEKFEPIPLHIEAEKPFLPALEEKAPKKNADSTIVDFCINEDTIVSY